MVHACASAQIHFRRRASVSFVESTPSPKGNIMDRTTAIGGSTAYGGNSNPMSPAGASVEGAAQSAHKTVDTVADRATEQVGRMSDTVHRAVNSATDAATAATEWASTLPGQAKEIQAKVTDAASASIRARPLTTIAGALVLGYLIGRLARI
jgi:hypothetical protein